MYLPKSEYVKMAQKELDIELRKKFQGIKFQNFFELVAKVVEYEEHLREKFQRNKSIEKNLLLKGQFWHKCGRRSHRWILCLLCVDRIKGRTDKKVEPWNK